MIPSHSPTAWAERASRPFHSPVAEPRVAATLDTAGTQTITANDSTATLSATSGAITVSPGAVTQLLITTQPPSTVSADTGFGLTVTAKDAYNNVATGFTGSETVALVANPGGSTLGGTLIVNATSGVASFSGLTLNKGRQRLHAGRYPAAA